MCDSVRCGFCLGSLFGVCMNHERPCWLRDPTRDPEVRGMPMELADFSCITRFLFWNVLLVTWVGGPPASNGRWRSVRVRSSWLIPNSGGYDNSTGHGSIKGTGCEGGGFQGVSLGKLDLDRPPVTGLKALVLFGSCRASAKAGGQVRYRLPCNLSFKRSLADLCKPWCFPADWHSRACMFMVVVWRICPCPNGYWVMIGDGGMLITFFGATGTWIAPIVAK